jgi:hypothetical protein
VARPALTHGFSWYMGVPIPHGTDRVVCWSIWKVRNKMVIEQKLIRSHHVVIFNIIMLMQQWRALLSDEEVKESGEM